MDKYNGDLMYTEFVLLRTAEKMGLLPSNNAIERIHLFTNHVISTTAMVCSSAPDVRIIAPGPFKCHEQETAFADLSEAVTTASREVVPSRTAADVLLAHAFCMAWMRIGVRSILFLSYSEVNDHAGVPAATHAFQHRHGSTITELCQELLSEFAKHDTEIHSLYTRPTDYSLRFLAEISKIVWHQYHVDFNREDWKEASTYHRFTKVDVFV